MLPEQFDLIHAMDWQTLIILDACRFDCFEAQYGEYLKGKLTRVRSAGLETKQWLRFTWKDWYELVYISANPYINSVGYAVRGWKAIDHFREIVDVWNFGYDEDIGWIPPRAVNKAVLDRAGDDRMVVHYVQPHGPYIGRTGVFTRTSKFKLRDEMLGLPDLPAKRKGGNSPVARTREDKNRAIVAAYRETLDLVLERVSEIIPILEGKTIVSSDHGEIMGECGRYGGHMKAWEIPGLREVPWLEVEA